MIVEPQSAFHGDRCAFAPEVGSALTPFGTNSAKSNHEAWRCTIRTVPVLLPDGSLSTTSPLAREAP
jgi:hypothetical protein